MKKTVTLCALLLGLLIVNNALAVTVDGYCYLEGETNHSGTKVLFSAVSPSAVTDSTYTNADGSFLIGLSLGIYTVHYSHEGWLPYTIPGEIGFFEDTTLDDVTLSSGSVEEVSGPQSGIWTSDYIYQVVGDISVNNGDTLIIEPGVTVEFMDYYSFTIYGKLFAVGTETDTIRFTSGQPSSNPTGWNQIKFDGSSASNSVISYSKIEYANFGIVCDSSSPTISNNTISNNYYGIDCSYSSPSISNNTISNNAYGIVCYSSSPTISNNTISNNSDGIECWDSSSPTISNNTISNNNDYGIYCLNSSSPTISNNTICNNNNGIDCWDSTPTISNNTISNNSDGIECWDSSTPTISNNMISNNSRGIRCSSSSYPTILNNILYDNYYGIYASSSPSALEYNLFWLNSNAGSGSGIPPYFGQIVAVNANGDSCDAYFNLFMDPIFVNPDSLDFHLTENSPCIDAGNPDTTGLNLPPFDLDGNPRIYNGIIDIGCYEWQGVGIDNWYKPLHDVVLYQNYPNPFNFETTISFNLATKSHKNTQIKIYNLKGQLVRNFSIVNHLSSIVWDGKDENGNQLSNGIYFYQLKTENYSEVKKMVIIR